MPNLSGKNGSKELPPPPNAVLRPLVEDLAKKGKSGPQILAIANNGKHYDTSVYRLTLPVLKKRRWKWKVPSARSEAHTLESIGPAIERMRARYPKQGSHDMKVTLLHEEKIHVPRTLILEYMRLHHPAEVFARRMRYLRRKVYYTAGVNDIWSFDQHDKWRRFQLFLHVGVEVYSGKILWLKIWWTNRNPRLVFGYYCDAVAEHRGMPLLTQSDPGSENNGIANGHTLLRHFHDPSLSDTLQHLFKGAHRNIKPEIFWSILRRKWTPGFEDLLDFGVHTGLYNPDIILERLGFHFVFIPLLQKELDLFKDRQNQYTKPRFDKHKVLPDGRPDDIFFSPEQYGSKDFSVAVDLSYLTKLREEIAPYDDPVFHLVPPDFHEHTSEIYKAMGNPLVTRENAWQIYTQLLGRLRAFEHAPFVVNAVSAHQSLAASEATGKDLIEVLNLNPYRAGGALVGHPQEDRGGDGQWSSSEGSDGGLEWTGPSGEE